MRRPRLTLSLCFLILALACGGTQTTETHAPASTPEQNVNVSATTTSVVPISLTCALLSRADVESLQGEAYASAQGSEHLGDGLVKSQCFYRLPTFSKSINLEVVRVDPNADSLAALKKFWDEKFSPEAIEERERELKEKSEREQEKKLEREKERGQLREGGHDEEEREDEEETERPRRINGLGKAAFWTGGESGGSLHVLLKDASIRVSIGSEQSEPARIKSAVALARKVLTHF
jgi:hypothetical protein